MVISGITDGYAGAEPDCGAYEVDGNDWTAGHNFSSPPNPTFASIDTAYINKVANSSFENGWTSWTKTGALNATPISSNSWNYSITTARAQDKHLRLGTGTDGIQQELSGLSPNTTYTLSAWVKADLGETVAVGASNFGGTDVSKTYNNNLYGQVIMDFTTGTASTTATISISKTTNTNGYAYVDLVGVVKKDTATIADSFEGGLSNWQTGYGTPQTSNALAHTGSSSLIINQDQEVLYKELGASYNKIASLWFYDDITNQSIECMARVDEGTYTDDTSWRGLGVKNSVSADYYVVKNGATYTATTVSRKTGWHELKWNYTSGTRADMYIDGILVASPTGVTAFSRVAFGDFQTGITVTNPVYFDDFSISDGDTDLGNFENGFGGWSRLYGTPNVSSEQKHSGNWSYAIDEDQEQIIKTWGDNQNKVVRVWFYDDATDTSLKCVGDANDGTTSRAIGVRTDISTTKYVYTIASDTWVESAVPRKTGWHEFKWDYTSGTGVDMCIDGYPVITGLTGCNYFNRMLLGDEQSDAITGKVFFDDLTVSDFDGYNYITVSNVSINNTSLETPKGYKTQLTATITPSNSTLKDVAWSSGNSSVATVDQYGVVTAVAPGTATITAQAEFGQHQATCQVTVNSMVNSLAVYSDFNEGTTGSNLPSTSGSSYGGFYRGDVFDDVKFVDDPSANNKGVKLNWGSGTYNQDTRLYAPTFSIPSTGVVITEFKLKSSGYRAGSSNTILRFAKSGGGSLDNYFGLTNSYVADKTQIQAQSGTGYTSVMPYDLDQWYAFKVVIFTATGTYDLYIDGVKKVTQAYLNGASSTLNPYTSGAFTTWLAQLYNGASLTPPATYSSLYVADVNIVSD